MTIQTEQVAASLAAPSVAVTRRTEGVRRVDDLHGWDRVLGEGIRLNEAKR